MSYRPTEVVEVRAWGRTVGATAYDENNRCYAFEYDDGWVRSGPQLAPIFMPNRPGVFVFPDLDRASFYGLPALLADALPDRFGNAIVDAAMAAQGISPADITPLDRLAYTASRGMGALEFFPPAEPQPPATRSAIQLADLVVTARQAVSGDLSTEPDAHDALRQLIQVGTSAGGARAKAVIAYDPATGRVRSGQLAAPEGFEHWLIKLDGVDVSADGTSPFGGGEGFGRIELAYHRMATAAGIDMMPSAALPEGPRTHFLTRRFDRGPRGERHHLLTLCAMAHLDFRLPRVHSYSQFFATIDALGLEPRAREQAFRRMVFNVAAVNRDDHTKNFAFLLREGGDWELAPAYDVVWAHNASGPWTAQHQMSVNGRFEAVTLDDLETVGERHLVPGRREAVAEVLAAVDRWREHAEEAGVDPVHRDHIQQDIETHRPT